MDEQTARMIFDLLYADINGYAISQAARNRLSHVDQALTYGEVTFDTFAKMLQNVAPAAGEVFCDLGSGTGKAVLAAHMLHDFSRAVGVEVLDDLHQTAISVQSRFGREFRPSLPEPKQKQSVEFIQKDFLHHDFSDADVVFVHATCMYDALLTQLDPQLSKLKPGARVMTVSKPVLAKNLKEYKVQIYNMAWGQATVFFYKKA